jgi:hypothetical protein
MVMVCILGNGCRMTCSAMSGRCLAAVSTVKHFALQVAGGRVAKCTRKLCIVVTIRHGHSCGLT